MKSACVGWIVVIAALVALEQSSGARQPARVERPPNIVLILADDMGYAEMGMQGNTDVPTPSLDAMARAGVRFTNGYVSAPICAPTRAGLLTGRYQQRFGFETNPGPEAAADPRFGLPRTEATLAERLKAAGYATGMVGKWHLGFKPELQPTARGFDEFFGFLGGANTYLPAVRRGAARSPLLRGTQTVVEQEYLTDAFGREAVAFIERHRQRPFFLYLSFNAVHAPMEATTARLERVGAITDPTRRTFAAMLSAMDENIGRVVAALQAHGLEDDTLIVFLSDNGGPTDQTTSSNLPLRGVKGQVFEGGIRVPFVLQWRGRLPAAKTDDRPVIALDIHPTVLAAAGQPVSADWALDGVNLLPFLTGEKSGDPHDTLYWRFQRQHAIRRGDWKLVQLRGGATPELYNLESDRGEATNLASREPGKLKELEAAWTAWKAMLMDPQWRRESGAAPGAERSVARGGQTATAVDDRFRRLDLNRDGKLTPDELPRSDLFKRMDANGDGVVTLDEARAHYGRRRR